MSSGERSEGEKRQRRFEVARTFREPFASGHRPPSSPFRILRPLPLAFSFRCLIASACAFRLVPSSAPWETESGGRKTELDGTLRLSADAPARRGPGLRFFANRQVPNATLLYFSISTPPRIFKMPSACVDDQDPTEGEGEIESNVLSLPSGAHYFTCRDLLTVAPPVFLG
jgi:hypothetical protein